MNSTMLRSSAFTGQQFQKPRPCTSVVSAPVSRSGLLVENRVAIRFQRGGRHKLPFYRLVALDSRTRRDGQPLEYLGWYDPLKKETQLNAPAIKKWLAVGAQPSQTVETLLRKAFVLDPLPPWEPKPQKGSSEKKPKKVKA
jgi:small subunit ribosomal protein S16